MKYFGKNKYKKCNLLLFCQIITIGGFIVEDETFFEIVTKVWFTEFILIAFFDILASVVLLFCNPSLILTLLFYSFILWIIIAAVSILVMAVWSILWIIWY